MNIDLKESRSANSIEGYEDNDEEGVRRLCGKLDIRPPYQREFIYKDKQRDAVIDTVTRGLPPQCHVLGSAEMTATTKSSTASSARSQFASTSRVTSLSRPLLPQPSGRREEQILDYP